MLSSRLRCLRCQLCFAVALRIATYLFPGASDTREVDIRVHKSQGLSLESNLPKLNELVLVSPYRTMNKGNLEVVRENSFLSWKTVSICLRLGV
jgi:hypothetical protein